MSRALEFAELFAAANEERPEPFRPRGEDGLLERVTARVEDDGYLGLHETTLAPKQVRAFIAWLQTNYGEGP